MKTYFVALTVSVGVFSITSAPRMATDSAAILALVTGALLLTTGALISLTE